MPLTDSGLEDARRALAAALDGSGPPVEFTADGRVLPRPEATDPSRGGSAGVVAVVRTSGSTGAPKQTLLTREALAASAAATAARIGGEGQWLLAVGLQFVAGLAVLSRSLRAGTTPVPTAPGPFTARGFAEAVDRLERGTGFRAVSLVPTQLARLLSPDDGPDRLALDALRTFDVVLVGGARVPDTVRAAAADARIALHLTYGMSETCGGCVYDGVPLEDVTAEVVHGADGDTPRLRLSGPVVAAGYLDDPGRTAEHFGTGTDGDPARRWYLTEDTGTVQGAPGHQHLTVTGRVDDVIITGGVKVSAARVQGVLESLPGVRAAFVGGIPDDEWGQRLCAAVATDASWDESAARSTVRQALGPAAAPKDWLVLDALPLLPNGKTDRQSLLERFRTS
ncbi:MULTISPECIES: AMP-binding protein [Micrococcaceae]|uniref:AMP-binding protein n=1 Tax=Micrococcaceae TaxID=1268 RepID=UPI001618C25C|nr:MULTISPECIES: AMP-binding protein [Micrococcaceae]MBB5749758.1 O-succinylbenzoic acid--CoA ligase [Micrococcus sp. TA1]HRO29910.1 AMP-binding protein [Citricoccus sp.]HRO94728.1 AMP-binding protein [Citricoccus sp.]